MRQKFGRHINSFIPALSDCMAKMADIAVDDDCAEQVKLGDPVMLTLCGSVTDLTLTTDSQRILESVLGFRNVIQSAADKRIFVPVRAYPRRYLNNMFQKGISDG